MTALDLRTELHRLIDGVSDTSLLEAIRSILKQKANASEWRSILAERSRQADAEYAAGLGKDLEQLKRELDEEYPG